MDKESKLEKEVKKLYIGYEDRNPINKELFKLAKKAIKKGKTIFEYVEDFDIKPIRVETFSWENFDLKDYVRIINNHIEYLNKKFNGYFEFRTNNCDNSAKVHGCGDSYFKLSIIYKICCNKVMEVK